MKSWCPLEHVRAELIQRIERLTAQVILGLCNGDAPSLSISGRSFSLKRSANGNARNDCESARKMIALWCILGEVHKRLLEKSHVNLRLLYYAHQDLFESMPDCTRIITLCGELLHSPRHDLCVVNTAKGYLAGQIRLSWLSATNEELSDSHWSGDVIDLAESGKVERIHSDWLYVHDRVARVAERSAAVTVERHFDAATRVRSARVEDTDAGVALHVECTAQVILVVEKDTIFDRIVVEDQICRRYVDAICITGRGVPDFASRACLSTLSLLFDIPVVVLTDFNPWGCQIFLCYKYASENAPRETATTGVSTARWMGMNRAQVDMFRSGLAPGSMQRMKKSDQQKIESLLEFCGRKGDLDTARDLRQMLDLKLKCELEALNSLSADFLAKEFIPHELELYGLL